MLKIKHGACFVPVALLEQWLDESALRILVRNEFYHAQEALHYYLSDEGARSLTQEENMWVLALAFDGHRSRWGGRAIDYSAPILELIPDYALLSEEQA